MSLFSIQTRKNSVTPKVQVLRSTHDIIYVYAWKYTYTNPHTQTKQQVAPAFL
jgi:hypothetical protein